MALTPEQRRAERRLVEDIAKDLDRVIAYENVLTANTPAQLADAIATIQAAAAQAYAKVTQIVAARS
jgi:uncharacterized protein YydD (DUF2326 family)